MGVGFGLEDVVEDVHPENEVVACKLQQLAGGDVQMAG
jgi:hypothetical protein